MILVSACLCGVHCKYNGGSNFNETVLKLMKEGKAMLACPEQLGGLTTPREPQEIHDGTGSDVLDGKAKVITKDEKDSTENFLKGAYETLKIAKEVDAKIAILKARSPSCGYGEIYDGSFLGKVREGNGVTAELLERNGITVYTEETLDQFFKDESI